MNVENPSFFLKLIQQKQEDAKKMERTDTETYPYAAWQVILLTTSKSDAVEQTICSVVLWHCSLKS